MNHSTHRFDAKTIRQVIVLFFLSCTVLFGCTNQVTVVPTTTPVSEMGTDIPEEATIVSLTELITNPKEYQDQYVRVQGINEGTLNRPACSPLYGPPTIWGLVGNPGSEYEKVHDRPPRLEVGNFIDQDWFFKIIDQPVEVWGWFRLYIGPIGCGTYKNQTPTTDNAPIGEAWYLEAIKVRVIE